MVDIIYLSTKYKLKGAINMRKAIMVLFLAAVIFGLAACGRAAEYEENAQMQTLPIAQDYHAQNSYSSPSGRIVTGTVPAGEILAGTVKAIDGMLLSVDTSSVFMAATTGAHTVLPGEEPEPQEEIVRITEETVIEIRTLGDGQIMGNTPGTLDDISVQAVIMAEGEWEDDEFIAATITIMDF